MVVRKGSIYIIDWNEKLIAFTDKDDVAEYLYRSFKYDPKSFKFQWQKNFERWKITNHNFKVDGLEKLTKHLFLVPVQFY